MGRKVTINGIEYKSISEACRELKININSGLISARLKRGWSIEEAFFTTTDDGTKRKCQNLTYNHEKLSDYKERFLKYNLTPIEEYINNVTALKCVDKDGYIVKVSLANIEANDGKYLIFSVGSNEECFLHNINNYCKINNINCKALDWKKGTSGSPDVLFECECGRKYWRNFNFWKNLENNHRCKSCTSHISSYEKKIIDYLDYLGINYELQYTFEDCKGIRPLPFDFYLPKFNTCIEVDGEQHYMPIEWFTNHGLDFEKRQIYDNIKTEYCKNNNISLIRISYKDIKSNKNYQNIIKSIIG